MFTCCCSHPKSCPTLATPWTAAHQAPLSFTVSRSLLKFIFIELVMSSNHLIFCCPLILLPSIPPSIRVFSNEWAVRIRWPKYWSFNFSISPSHECQDWFPLGLTGLISLLSKGLSRVFSNSKASILWCLAFFMIQVSHLYTTTEKSYSFDHTDSGKVMSLPLSYSL